MRILKFSDEILSTKFNIFVSKVEVRNNQGFFSIVKMFKISTLNSKWILKILKIKKIWRLIFLNNIYNILTFFYRGWVPENNRL
jgi:hypothetical protein